MKLITFDDVCKKSNKPVKIFYECISCPTIDNPNNSITGLAIRCSNSKLGICNNCKNIK